MNKSFITRKDFLKLLGSVAGIGAISYYLGLRNHPAIDSADDDPNYRT